MTHRPQILKQFKFRIKERELINSRVKDRIKEPLNIPEILTKRIRLRIMTRKLINLIKVEIITWSLIVTLMGRNVLRSYRILISHASQKLYQIFFSILIRIYRP